MDFFGDNVKFKMQIQALASLLSIFANIYYINNADINLLSVINVRFVLFYNIVHYISIQPMRKAILELKKPLKNLNRHLTLSHLFIYIAILFFGLIWMFFTPSLKPQYNISTLKLIICFGSSVLIESLAEKDVIVAMNYDNTKQLTIGQCLALIVRQVGPAVLMSFNLSSTVTSFCFCQLIGSIAFVVVHHRMGKEYSYLVDSPTDKAFPTTFNQIKHFYDKEILNQVWNNYKYGLHELTWKHCASIVMTFTNLLTLKEQFIFNQIQFLSLAIINGAFMPIIEYINNDLQYKIYKNSRIGDYNEDKAVELTSTIKSTLKGFILSGVIVCLFSCTYSQTIIKMYNVTLLANNSGGKLLFLQSCYLALIMIYELIENLITSSLQEKAVRFGLILN
uniref:Protein RFT1 homolog n=1 Tax=Rhabditophanes sp. KR3021 TaxID=114890 RepID=A0AC35TLP2_9BILA